MALPKIKHPIYEFKIPSTGKRESFRPFLVKEEKILLMARASDDPADMFRALKQVVNNCSISDSFDVDTLAIFDLEYLFLQLRAISVGETVEVAYRDNEDQQVYKFQINLKEVQVEFPEGVEKVIPVTDTTGIKMKWPSASILSDTNYTQAGDEAFYELVVKCIDQIYDGEDLFDPKDYSAKEIEEFLDDCGVQTFEKIQEFMSKVPRLYYKIEYKNTNGSPRKIELQSLADFFTLR